MINEKLRQEIVVQESLEGLSLQNAHAFLDSLIEEIGRDNSDNAEKAFDIFFRRFIDYVTRTMEFPDTDRGNIGHALPIWEARFKDSKFVMRKGDIKNENKSREELEKKEPLSLADKIRLTKTLVDWVYKEGKEKNPE